MKTSMSRSLIGEPGAISKSHTHLISLPEPDPVYCQKAYEYVKFSLPHRLA